MFAKKNLVIVYVSGREIVIAVPGKPVEQLLLAKEIVSNQEVINPTGLNELLKTWAEKHPELKGGEVVWIFAPDMYFEYGQTEDEKGEWGKEAEKYVDLLPFEEVVWREYGSAEGKKKIIALNRDLYKALNRGMMELNFMTLAELPAGEIGQVISKGLNAETIKYVTNNLDALVKKRLVYFGETEANQIGEASEKTKKSNLPLLIGVMVVLLGVLGVMLIQMNK